MKKCFKLRITLLICASIPVLACGVSKEISTVPVEQESVIPSVTTPPSLGVSSPLATTRVPSPVPSTPNLFPTEKPQQHDLLPPDTMTATPTPTTFLPAELIIISPNNTSRLERVVELPEPSVSVVAYSPDGSRMAAGLFTSSHIKIWDLKSGQEVFALSGHVNPRIINYLAFSPDGTRLASGAQGWDAQNDSLIIWDVNTGIELQRFDGYLGAVSPDWRLVALTQREKDNDTTLILSDLSNGAVIDTLSAPGDIYGVSFSPEGDRVAANMYDVFQDLFSFWSIEDGLLERTLYDWLGFSFSPDGRFIAAVLISDSGSDKGELNIFDATTFKWKKTLAAQADSLWYTFPAFSPDGDVLAASLGDSLVLWETDTWNEIGSFPISSPTGIAFSPDGKLITTYTQSGITQLWGVPGDE